MAYLHILERQPHKLRFPILHFGMLLEERGNLRLECIQVDSRGIAFDFVEREG